MKKSAVLLAVFGLFGFGCSEYDFSDDFKEYGEPNPPELANPIRNDRIVQVTTPSVDVLWVIDNSCSMEEEQNALAANFDSFINWFVDSGLDWHVGVVSTDMQDPNHRGRLRDAFGYKFIDSNVPNPTSVFSTMARLGVSGHYDEEGRAATFTALEILKNGYNAGFIRDEATLSIITISDEDDYSTQPTLPEFINWLLNYKQTPDMVTASAIVGPPGFSCAVEAGQDYMDVVDAVGGIKWNICNPDWATVLDELGMQAAGLKREFFLTEVPVTDPFSIEVRVHDGQNTYVFSRDTTGDPSCEVCFVYHESRNSITFNNFVPEPLAEVEIEYELLSAFNPNTGSDEEGDEEEGEEQELPE